MTTFGAQGGVVGLKPLVLFVKIRVNSWLKTLDPATKAQDDSFCFYP